MKTRFKFLMAAAVLAVGFTSCSKDDSDGPAFGGEKSTMKISIPFVKTYAADLNATTNETKFVTADVFIFSGSSLEKHVSLAQSSIPNLVTDMVYYVKPNLTNATSSPYMNIDFPETKLTIRVLNTSGNMTLKWTGEIDNDWDNPSNWVQVLTDGSEIPVLFAPVGCVDVIIPDNRSIYPELNSIAQCGTIHMGDRAMISGIHWLTYESASVDFKPLPSEKERFVMWSAPLKDMYTGDYHFLNASNAPDWGHVYMNFFQSANPDYASSVETEKTFTATFGSTGTPLPLGKAFNVKVMSGREDSFSFPKTATSYTDANGNSSGTLSRTNSGRFITDGVLQGDGSMALPVSGNNSFSLIQVVNPFLAYLDVNAFLSANSGSISGSYKLWNGDVNADFITVLAYEDNAEMRYVIDDNQMSSSSASYIAPLQSFFVTKLSSSASVGTLTMNAGTMTTTKVAGQEGSYVLRSATRGGTAEDGVLRVTAISGDAENSTVLLLRAGATPAFNASEDAEKSFNSGVPVSVYSLTDAQKAVAINASEKFEGDVNLGLRIKNASGLVSLSFTGVSEFGQKVYLIDHAQNDKEIDLLKETTYVFTVDGVSADQVTELNNRFTLRFGENATGIENVINDKINVIAKTNRIDVSSSSLFDRVEVIDLSGIRIYDYAVPSSYCQVPVDGSRVYLVKVTVGGKQIVKKVFVK